MSNHYHIIATATEDNLHRAMQYFNSRVAVRYNKLVGRSGHLWGDRYGSCIIDTDEHYLATVRYVYQNPLRAGIVDDLEEYNDSTFQYYAFGKKVGVVLVDDHLVLRLNGNKRKVGEYFRGLVFNEEIWISDREVKKGLRMSLYLFLTYPRSRTPWVIPAVVFLFIDRYAPFTKEKGRKRSDTGGVGEADPDQI